MRKRWGFKKREVAYILVITILFILLVGSWIFFFLLPSTADLQRENLQLRKSLASQHFLMYGAVHYFPPNTFATLNIPDTFHYHDEWKSDAPVTVFYLSNKQFVEYYNCRSSPNPASCITGDIARKIGPATSSSDVFTLSEGCGSYIAVYQWGDVGGRFYPNITVTYNPSNKLTGVCATGPGD